MTVKKFVFGLLMSLLLVIGFAPLAQAAVYNVVDAGSAWPSDVFGIYTENGTNNGRPCYEGPNGFWLYHGQWSGIDTWFIGNIKGETEINSSGVRFFYCGSQMSPPLDTYFDHTNSALGGVKVTASAGSPPSAPASLMSSGATGSSYVCNWSDVSNATGYKLEVSTSSSFTDLLPGYDPKTIVIPAGTPLSERPVTATISGLSPGTGYYTRIRSYNGFGDSANTNAAVITTIPETPAVESASDIFDTGFQANWTPRSGTLSYHLYVSAAEDFSSYILDNMTVADDHYVVTGLSPNTTYHYKVSASNAAGDSGQSAIMSVTTAPAKPADVNTSAITSNSFTANWGAAAGASGYYLDVASDASFTALLPAYTGLDVGNVTSCSVAGLVPYTQYYLRLSSYSINGTSSPSTACSVQTLPVAAEVTTGASVETDVFSAVVSGSITSLGIPSASEHGFCWNTTGDPTISDVHTSHGPVTSTGEFSGTLNDLLPVTNYYVRAYATNEAGTVYGQAVPFTTLAANHAPVLHGTSVVLDGTDENTTSSATYVYTFLNASDEDLPPNVLGIAIVGQSGRGTWQYSLDGSSWISFGTVSPSASLLNINALIRYIPDGTNGETAYFSFRAWDNTSGSEGEKVDTSTNGGYSSFSSEQGEASLTVTSINDAPVLVATGPSLAGTDENTVSAPTPIIFLLNASDTDLPPNSLGTAVTNVTGRGTWQYTEDGAVWLDITGVSPSSALLLSSAVQIRYCPDGINGETATISYRAWDGTSGSQNAYADTTVNGGSTSFSTAQDTAALIVAGINDAPALVSGPFTFDPTDLVTVSHAYQVSEMAEVSDVDLGALSGIAVAGVYGSGTWQYSDDGDSWTNFGTVSPTSALLLSSDQYIHYIPSTSGGAETASLSFRAWDQTSGSTGAKSDITTNGGTTAFSTNVQTASITVTIPVYSISGQVSTGSGLAGAVMNGLPGSPVTDSAGNYSAEVSYGWSGTVTPQLTGYTFTPASRTYTSIDADQPGNDYSALINTYDINVSAAPVQGGSADCVTANGIDIPHGTPVTVTAEANSGWSFINWTEGGTEVSSTASYTFSAAADRNLVANFVFDPIQIVPVPTDEVVSIILPPGITPEDVEYHISVAAGVTDPKIQLAVEGGTAVAPQLTITTSSQVELQIAAGTEITGPAGWDGQIGLPVISSTPSRNLGGDHFVIQVGLDSGSLNFTEPVQLYAPGQGHKEVKVIRGSTVYDVTEELDENSLEAARAILQDGTMDAKYIDGSDLYIWTIRFSEFVAYTERSSGGDITFGPNGGQISDQGVIVYIPAGALNGSASIKIQAVIESSDLTPVNGRLLSSVFEVVSSYNEDLDKPARITLPFDETKMDNGYDRISLCFYDEDSQSWQETDNVIIVGETVSGEADRFGRFAVIAFKTPADDEDDKTVSEEEPAELAGFKDIKGHWAENNIMELVGRGHVSGYPDNTFRPERNISRAEFAVMLVQAFDLEPRDGKVFSDTRNHWAKDYIATANGYGIINGYSEQYFGPDDMVSREQMAVMISLAVGLAAGDGPTGFTDQDSISVWALPYVKAARDNHIMNGYPDGSFLPAGKATRAEAVTIIVNALKK